MVDAFSELLIVSCWVHLSLGSYRASTRLRRELAQHRSQLSSQAEESLAAESKENLLLVGISELR